MKSSGKARFVGISIQNHQPANVLKALDTGLIEAVQVIYNIFDQSPEDELFPYCQKHGIGVIVRVPFDEGSLTGKLTPDTNFPEGDFRHNYFTGGRKQEAGSACWPSPSIWASARRNAGNRAALLPLASGRLHGYSRHAKLQHVAANTAASDPGRFRKKRCADCASIAGSEVSTGRRARTVLESATVLHCTGERP